MNSQVCFDSKFIPKSIRTFGGQDLIGRRKSMRPLSSKHPINLTIKTSTKTNPPIYSRRLKAHQKSVMVLAKKFHIKIYDLSFNYNHVHIVLQTPTREAYKSFIRTLCSKMVQISGYKKIFEFRPHTRIANWGRDFKNLIKYLKLNDLENDGIPRKNGRILTSIWASDPPI